MASDIQRFLLGALGGAGEGITAREQQQQAITKENALQQALEERAEQTDQRNGLPPSVAWALATKSAGLDPATPMPPDFHPGRQLSQYLTMGGARDYGADQSLAGRKYAADHRPAPRVTNSPVLDEAKADALARTAAIQTLGGKHGQSPDLTKITDPAEIEAMNNAYARSRGPNYKGGPLIASVPGTPSTGLGKWGMGILGTAGAPASSRVLPAGAPAAAPLANPLAPPPPAAVSTLDPSVAAGIKQAKGLGWGNDQIKSGLAQKGHIVSDDDIASVQ